MKKLLPLLAVAMLASCSQVQEGDVNATVGSGITISVDLPQTRTSLGSKNENGNYSVYWSAEDKLVANGSPSTKVTIKEDGSSAQFEFGLIGVGLPYNLTYPYTEGSLCAEGQPTVVFAAEQNYTEGTFGVGYAPMCGYNEGLGTTVLKHLAGVLRISPYGAVTLSKIEIIAAEGVALAGEFDVDCQTGAITAIEGKTGNKITYTINKALATDASTAEPFFITVPAGELGQCQVILTDSRNLQMTLNWNGKSVVAGVVREFKPFEFKVGASFELGGLTTEDDELVIEEPTEVTPTEPASNEIWYTATAKVVPYKTDVFGANIVSNVYENGKGVITFDAPVTSIGEDAFSNCYSLTSVTIGNSVTSIGEGAFFGCTSLTSVTIPDSVTSIGDYAFEYCTSLTSVTIPDSVTSIGELTFFECTSLTSVTIPDSVTSIGKYAFSVCSSLTAFHGKFASSDNRCLIVDGVLNSFAPAGLTEYTIPDSVTSIGKGAFYYCTSLTSVTIPDSVTSIGGQAFYQCTSLTSVTIPDSVTSIGNYAFEYCTSLTSVTIPDSVTSIGEGAFYYCTSLTSVTIPDSVTSIGDWAFYGCESLKEVYCKPTTPPAGANGMFSGGASGRKIYVPRNSVDAYKAKQYWSDYASYIEEKEF